MTATTLYGLEPVLAEELRQMGASKIVQRSHAVDFCGDERLLYNANVSLRCALRIQKPIYKFQVRNEDELYSGVQEIDWADYFGVNDTFAVDSVVHSDYFNHSKYAALKVKDAIVDQFRNKGGIRPSVDVDNPKVRINIYINEDSCILALDSSGTSLHKRGYRLEKNEAPLNEVLAAGLVMLSEWNKESNFIDPMCGSGTIVIEAAMMAYNIPPGINRTFGFMKWNDYNSVLWNSVRAEALSKIGGYKHKILGSDISQESIQIAKGNIARAKLQDKIELKVQSFEKLAPLSGGGILIFNPPYGERMKAENIEEFYAMIGDQLKQRFSGYDAWVFSGNKDALKHLGLRTSRKLTLYNGPLQCKFHKYSLYEGTKKTRKELIP